MKLRRRTYIIGTILVLVVIGAAAGVLHMRGHFQKSTAEADAAKVMQQVRQHYLLPSDEEPAVATVTNKSKISTPFLKSAENGDRVLIYQKNSLAIIYRPSIDRIVAVGNVQIDALKTGQEPE